jgi:hypothetical protein
MNVSNEQQVAEEVIVRALRATRANDAETAPRRHPRQTPQCPPLARFAAVLRSGQAQPDDWTEEERAHIRVCSFCQSLFASFRAAKEDKEAKEAALAREDTVMNIDASQETHTGLSTAPGTKKSGKAPKPPARPAGE